jgi:hypothetical protein
MLIININFFLRAQLPALVAQYRHWWRSTGTGGAVTGTGGAVPALVAQHRHWWRSV